ncbi:hypothetical protein [Vibrio casei]|uniref:hypothetical protein n=1 Tax=Vibrio casei TaxID=673372 RepID=UPI003F9B0CD4
MTPSKTAKLAGLKSLVELSELTGVSVSTLKHRFKHNRHLFDFNLNRALLRKENKGSE